MTTENALISLWAETSMHAGAGSSIDGVDLPIQRESHTGWPCIFGSSMKGALRAKAESSFEGGKDNKSIQYVFGPDSNSDKTAEHAGALLVSDARLLLLPIRSLTGHFKWVTCPAILGRLLRDAERLGVNLRFNNFNEPAKADAILANTKGKKDLFLEEYRLKLNEKKPEMDKLIKELSCLSGIAEPALNSQLVIVNSDLFSYLCKYATPVTPHIVIDNEKKTAENLWYEETLPPETVLYFALSAYKSRAEGSKMAAKDILSCITQELVGKGSPYLQIGGNETVGMGWCKVKQWSKV